MRLLVIDGNSIMNRAFYGIKLLSTKDGRFTNAVAGFLNIYDKLKTQLEPDHVAVAFDIHAPTFRHELYADYKAGRRSMPEELREQMPVIKELLSLMGCAVTELAGYEADDILGTLAEAAAGQGQPCFIATGDRDALQLVGDKVTVFLASTKMGRPETVVYDEKMIEATYGLTPPRLIDLKALMGDASDHIPGVPGVGEKTALQLLHQFGSLDGVYDNLSSPDIRDSLRQKLIAGRDSAYMSKELGTICRAVPVSADLADYALREPDRAALAAALAKLEMFKLIERWKLTAAATEVITASAFIDVTPEELYAVVKAGGKLDFLPRFENGELTAFWGIAGDKIAFIKPVSAEWLELLCDPAVEKRTHGGKPFYGALLARGLAPATAVMDTLLAAYLLNPLASDYSLIRLAREYGVPLPAAPEQAEETAQLSFDDVMTEKEPPDAGRQEAEIFPALADLLAEKLKETEQYGLLTDMEIPLSLVLADMELTGVAVDREGIAAFGERLRERIEEIQTNIYAEVGYAFNLNSGDQLGVALFEKLGLGGAKKAKTKTGKYSTNVDVLEKLRGQHPAVELLLEYRSLAKLKSTYCDGLLKVIGPDGRIHSSFNQTETRTGRISSTEPNLQNIPVRQELGRELRRFFKAADGCLLADADYSQIELRVLAHMADEPTMKEGFNTGADIHRITAGQVFGMPPELVTPEMRRRAKAVNFGIIYGIGAHSLSENIGVTHGEAKRYIEDYLQTYSKVAGFMEDRIASAAETGYAVTLFGRRRPLPELRSSNFNLRSFGERAARNTPIQGTAADIIKFAMIRVYRRLKAEGLAARLILQVHDELIVETPAGEAETVSKLIEKEMEAAAGLSVRLEAEVHLGKNWFEAKG